MIEPFCQKDLTYLNLNADNMLFCAMNNAILINQNSNRKIIVTGGVATCFVIILYHPQSKFTLFSHTDSSKDILKIQDEFISIFTKKGIPLQELQVYLAGGLQSFFESAQTANLLKAFWQKKPVILDASLLLSRDGIVVQNYSDFFGAINAIFKEHYCTQLKIPFQEYTDFLKEIVNNSDGFIYNRNRFENREYPITKASIYSSIEIAMGEAAKTYLRVRNICNDDYIEDTKLLMVQFIHNPKNESEKRIVVSFHDPFKSVLHLVGFNFEINQFFISTDDCVNVLTNAHVQTEKKLPLTGLTVPIFDFSNQEKRGHSEKIVDETPELQPTFFKESSIAGKENEKTLGVLLAQSLMSVTNQSDTNDVPETLGDSKDNSSTRECNNQKYF